MALTWSLWYFQLGIHYSLFHVSGQIVVMPLTLQFAIMEL